MCSTQARPSLTCAVKPVEVARRAELVVGADAHEDAGEGGRQGARRRDDGDGRRRFLLHGREVVLQEGVAGAAGGLALFFLFFCLYACDGETERERMKEEEVESGAREGALPPARARSRP